MKKITILVLLLIASFFNLESLAFNTKITGPSNMCPGSEDIVTVTSTSSTSS